MIRRMILIMGFALLLAPAGWAADGDTVSSTTSGDFTSQTYMLCDAKAGNVSCAQWDFNTHGGMPAWFTVSIDLKPGCSSPEWPTVTVNASTLSAGQKHVLVVLDSADSANRVEGPRRRYLQTDITNADNCTGTLVHLVTFHRRR